MIDREQLKQRVQTALHRSRILALIGPRQCGKTTLAREFVAPDTINYFDLENPVSLARLDEPMTALAALKGLVVIDEIQLRPELFGILRVLADRDPLLTRFLILGSASPTLMRRSAESLAGRVETIEMGGFALLELDVDDMAKHWLRGGFPRAYLADNEGDSVAWRRSFIQSMVDRDLPEFGIGLPSLQLLRLWTMLAHYHGQVWNAAEPARSLGIGETAVRKYLDIFQGTFMVRVLAPWHENLLKRQVRSPKLYVRDSGLLHQLLGIRSELDLLSHPKSGASWEGYAIEQVLAQLQPDEAYFWATHNGAELDLFMLKAGKRIGVECKRMDAPKMTPSMRTALTDLKLDRLLVIYPGEQAYPLAEQVHVMPLSDIEVVL